MPLRFRLTVPHDAQLVGAVRQVADRVAQCAGFSAADAETIASSVARAAEAIMGGPGSADRQGLDVRFERDATQLDVWLRYRAANGDSPSEATPAPLRSDDGDVEVGREGEVSYWRLRRALPRDKVNHRCELPPDR